MTRSSTPRRIPTEEIEVGRWYRVEDAVPADCNLMVQELHSDLTHGPWRGYELSASMSAWRYNGPIPPELPPREESARRPRFVGRSSSWFGGAWYSIYDHERSETVSQLGRFEDKQERDRWLFVLNLAHEALEGGA